MADYGLRPNGTKKGEGWLGKIYSRKAKDQFSTELTTGVEVDGISMDIPLLVPALTKAEAQHLADGGDPTKPIMDKAIDWAMKRKQEGLSPYKEQE